VNIVLLASPIPQCPRFTCDRQDHRYKNGNLQVTVHDPNPDWGRIISRSEPRPKSIKWARPSASLTYVLTDLNSEQSLPHLYGAHVITICARDFEHVKRPRWGTRKLYRALRWHLAR